MRIRARGFTALETTIAAGLMAILFAAVGTGFVREGAVFQSEVTAEVLAAATHEELRIAADALKYEGSSLQPAEIATTLPMPAGSPIPAQISLSLSPLPGGTVAIRVRTSSPFGSATLVREATLVVERRMPIPGSSITAATPVAAPFGAP